MKRYFFIAGCLLLALLTSGCNINRGRSLPILSVTTQEFDLDTAIDMVRELERPILALQVGDFVTRSELEEMQSEHAIFRGISVLNTFFDVADMEDGSKEELEVLGNHDYPTIFDADIEIARAYVETTVYDLGQNRADETVILHIEQVYTGDDREMKRFHRSYLFKHGDGGSWDLLDIGGMMNVSSGGAAS